MLTSKQRAQLRGLASKEDVIFQVGKGGISETLVRQVADALRARELIKLRVLEACELTPREACEELAKLTDAEPVCAIGGTLVLYKVNPKKPVIVLAK